VLKYTSTHSKVELALKQQSQEEQYHYLQYFPDIKPYKQFSDETYLAHLYSPIMVEITSNEPNRVNEKKT